MIFSKELIFSDAQAVTATAASTNVIDLGAPGTVYGASGPMSRDMGQGSDVYLRAQVVADFATLTSLTLTLEQDDDEAFGSAETVATTVAVPVAKLVAGYVFNISELPIHTTKRYIRLKYTVTGSNATAGAITAGMTAGNQDNY